jgi:heme/copper-type cytochrome/quinol oxidase subunit 2
MNNKQTIQEIIAASVFIVLSILLINPADFWMPSMMTALVLCIIVVAFGFFAGLIWREKGADEREQYHAMIAGRIGYLAGLAAIITGIIVQTVTVHSVDHWLVVALGVMVIAKIIALAYGRNRL